jgi:mercuric ion binding protein
MKILSFWSLVFALGSLPALAAEKSVTLDVSGMTCGTCPITVRKAITRVAGVIEAEVDPDKRQAIIRFDDAKTQVEALIRATTDAGYPSVVKGPAQ